MPDRRTYTVAPREGGNARVLRREFEDRRRQLFAKWIFQYEVGRRAQADTSEASVHRFYEENADLYTRTDGELTPPLGGGGEHSLLDAATRGDGDHGRVDRRTTATSCARDRR